MQEKRSVRTIDRVYDNFALSTQSRAFFVYDIRADYARWSLAALEQFPLKGEYLSQANAAYERNIHPDDLEIYRKALAEMKRGEQPRYALSLRAKDKSGEYVTCDCKAFVVRDYANRPAYLSVSVMNRGRNAQLDTVTELPNRYEYYRAVREKQEYKKKTLTLLLGTTNFVSINRLYGYEAGNRVLKLLVDGLVKIIGSKGTAYRAQGASVLVLTQEYTPDSARQLYAQLRQYARTKIIVDGAQIPVELAGGAVELDDFDVDEHTVYTCARYALEQSTRGRGKNLVIIRNDHVGDTNKTLAVINAMRTGIAKNCEGFYLCYQPLVSAQSNMLEGVEVLLRYENPKFGRVAPSLFLPALEKDDEFSRLGYWIIEQACREGKELLTLFPDLMLHINLDYVQLEEPRFRHTMLDILKRTDFPGKNICFELTENCKQLPPLFLKDEVLFLKGCNIKTALDGSCMTSLNLIRELPVDMIKVDREIITGIERNPVDQYMLEAVTGFARKMNIRVAIEGVETEATKNFLKKFPASTYQGFYYSEPVRLSELKELPLFRVSKA